MSGSKCTVKDKFFAKSSTDHFVVFKKEGSTYSPTPVAGPCIYMPAPEEYVAKFDMTSPSGTKEGFAFTYFSSAPQTMTMVVPGVDGGSLKLLVSHIPQAACLRLASRQTGQSRPTLPPRRRAETTGARKPARSAKVKRNTFRFLSPKRSSTENTCDSRYKTLPPNVLPSLA